MPSVPKKSSKKKPADPTAAARQKRRRQKLNRVDVLLSDERASKLATLLDTGYAPDRQAVLTKGLDEAYERHTKRKPRPEKA